MLSRVAASLRQLAGRLSPRGELVGRDAAGNQYFRAPRALDGGAGELRLPSLARAERHHLAACSSGDGAEPSQRAANGGPLHDLRVSSKEELDADVASPAPLTPAEGERRWVQFKERIPDPRSLPVEWASWLANTLLEKEEEKRRYRAKSIQESAGADDMSAESMGRLLEQISGVAPEGKSTFPYVPKVEERHPASANLWIGLSPPSTMPSSHLCMLHGEDRAPTSKSTLYRTLYRQILVGMATDSSLEHGGLHNLRLLPRG
eukprot:SM000122S25748  [mRNA]  locus=s122:86928:89032:+ [translate_table: standard]